MPSPTFRRSGRSTLWVHLKSATANITTHIQTQHIYPTNRITDGVERTIRKRADISPYAERVVTTRFEKKINNNDNHERCDKLTWAIIILNNSRRSIPTRAVVFDETRRTPNTVHTNNEITCVYHGLLIIYAHAHITSPDIALDAVSPTFVWNARETN